MADVIYNSFKQKIMDGSINLSSDTIKVALVTSSYTPDQDTHEDYADITNEVPNGSGYVTGGDEITTKTVTKDNTDNEGVFAGDDCQWTAATFTCRGGIIYKDTGTPATSWFIAYIDFGSDMSPVASTFDIQWDAEGIINIG